jgi:hypothetical protein
MIGLVGVFGENQDKNLAGINPLGDCFGPIGSWFDISGGDPALDPIRLEPLAIVSAMVLSSLEWLIKTRGDINSL